VFDLYIYHILVHVGILTCVFTIS